MYRDNKKLNVRVDSLLKASEKYRKRAERAEESLKKIKDKSSTPRSAAAQLLGDAEVNDNVRRTK